MGETEVRGQKSAENPKSEYRNPKQIRMSGNEEENEENGRSYGGKFGILPPFKFLVFLPLLHFPGFDLFSDFGFPYQDVAQRRGYDDDVKVALKQTPWCWRA
jgi:hypothetical protein